MAVKFQIFLFTKLDKKPFQCEVCEESFRVKGEYNRHLKMHSGKNINC